MSSNAMMSEIRISGSKIPKARKPDRAGSELALKASKQDIPKGKGSPKSVLTTAQHVRKYLAEASNKELDKLTEFLLKRRKKQGANLGAHDEEMVGQKAPEDPRPKLGNPR